MAQGSWLMPQGSWLNAKNNLALGPRAIFMVNTGKRIAGKLCRIILLHFGLVTFRFHYWKTLKHFHFHDFRILRRVHDSQNQLFSFCETPGDLKQSKKNSNYFPKSILGKNPRKRSEMQIVFFFLGGGIPK